MLFLPITDKHIEQLAGSDIGQNEFISRLGVPELAAVMLIQQVPELVTVCRSSSELISRSERYLAEFISSSNQIPYEKLSQLIVERYSHNQFVRGSELLSENLLYAISQEQFDERKYLTWDGSWNWEFKESEQKQYLHSSVLSIHGENQFVRVSSEEERILNIILSDRDEPIDVQGYAGTGKTWIITQLVEALDKQTTAFLSMTWSQVSALTSRVKGAKGETFAGIARSIFETNLIGSVRNISKRYGAKYTMSDEKIASHLQCHDIGNNSATSVARLAWRVVAKFCYTSDPEIQLSHIQNVYRNGSVEQQLVLLGVAKNLWDAICIPRDGVYLPIRNYHLVKALALTGLGVPDKYSFIVVDESHNLPPPVTQILQKSHQPVYVFGDHYQALEGIHHKHDRPATLRTKNLSCSVRAGANVGDLYNKIIDKHPIAPVCEFSGNLARKTNVIRYDKFEIPERYCAILSRSIWSVFAVAWKLHKSSAKYHIADNAKKELKWIIDGAILFYKTGVKPNHYAYMSASTWEEFVENHNEPVVRWVDNRLRGGFGFEDMDAILKNSTPTDSNNLFVIGRVSDCLNREYDGVLLLDDMVGDFGFIDNDHAKVISHVYTGISRAKHELLIPANLDGWFDDFWQT